ncbi:hypothetical protein [Prosthecobacter sp.]|uniref:hypothetical protein n=1 Tax=Prosthecobacter sp. TaxID=1965333 RepID=UPI003784156D
MKLRLACLGFFVVVWLIPFFVSGAMLGPLPVRVYSRLNFQYTAAGLFTRRVPVWHQTLIQVQSKGAADWKTIDTAELSPMGAFGFRQRVDRVLMDTNSHVKVAPMVRQRLAEWVAKEYAKLHPNEGEVTGVRMGNTIWTTHRPEMANPSGEWVRDPVDIKPSAPFRPYASFTVTQGKAVADRMPPSTPAVTAPASRTPKTTERPGTGFKTADLEK